MTSSEDGARLSAYVEGLFAPEDDLLKEIREEISRRGLPEIYISPELGRLLQVLLSGAGAHSVLEVGTLGGYSAIWMARVLPPGGRLVTVEVDPDRAALARGFVARAGLESMVEVRVGDGREVLERMVDEGDRFDAVFIDADKEGYPEYLDRALELVRPGGLILADNAFRDGRVLDAEPDEATRGVMTYNERVASDPRLESTIVPVRDGLTVAVFRRDAASG